MKLLLAIVAVVILAGSFYADYKWRQWISSRRRDRNHSNFPTNR